MGMNFRGFARQTANVEHVATAQSWYHGTRHELTPGQELTGGHMRANQGAGQPGEHVYYSGRKDVASFFGEAGNGPDHDIDARPRLYKVTPLEGHEIDPDEDPDFKSFRAPRVRVDKEIAFDHKGMNKLHEGQAHPSQDEAAVGPEGAGEALGAPALTETPPCPYCGSREVSEANETGRGHQYICAACGGAQSTSGDNVPTPELIGDPSNHPKGNADPDTGGVGGAGNLPTTPKVVYDRPGEHRMPSWEASRHTAANTTVSRVFHNDPGCPVCNTPERTFRTSALANPETGDEHWFHGTSYHPLDTHDPAGARRSEPGGNIVAPKREPGAEDMGRNAEKHWNTDLGAHFTSLHEVAKGFATDGSENPFTIGMKTSRIAHSSLHIQNPAHYEHESDMTKHVVDWALDQGHKYVPRGKANVTKFRQGDFDNIEHKVTGETLGYHHELEMTPQRAKDMIDIDRLGTDGHAQKARQDGRGRYSVEAAHEQWVRAHPLRENITKGFRQHLMDQGHDGITYGNEHEGPHGHKCAITFPEHNNFTVHKWEWLHPEGDDVQKEVQQKAKNAALIGDPELRFTFCATWHDVRNKARDITRTGGVRIAVASGDGVGGEVQGEHNVYETFLTYVPGTRKVAYWHCGCKWGTWAWGRSPAYARFEGRMCSHALAMQFEAQKAHAFNRREVSEHREAPEWLRPNTKVVVHHQRATDDAPERDHYRYASSGPDVEGVYPSGHGLDLVNTPLHAVAHTMLSEGSDPGSVMRTLLAFGAAHEPAQALVRQAVINPELLPTDGTQDAREHAEDFGAGVPADGNDKSVTECSQCEGVGCGACGGTGQMVDGKTPIPDQNADAGVKSRGLEGLESSLHGQQFAVMTMAIYDALRTGQMHVAEYASGDPFPYSAPEVRNPSTKPDHSFSQNPGSTGWATSQDPHDWDDAWDHRSDLGGQHFSAAQTYGPEHVWDHSVGDDDQSGFGDHHDELSRYKHDPDNAEFRLTHVPIAHMRQHTIEGLEPLPKYHELDDGDPDDRDRLDSLEQMRPEHMAPGIGVQHGRHTIMLDGRHRAAILAQHGHTHMPMYVTNSDEGKDIHRSGSKTAGHDAYGEWDGEGDPDDYEEHHDEHSSEWDDIHSGMHEMHRGVAVMLNHDDHAIVHDQSRPLHERAHHLLNVLKNGDHNGGLGSHWTTEHRVAEDFADGPGVANHLVNQSKNHAVEHNDHRYGTDLNGAPKGQPATSVMLHAHPPERHAIDEHPDPMAHGSSEMYGYHDHGEREVPLHPGSHVEIKGLSFKPKHNFMDEPDEEPEFEHHEFHEAQHHMAKKADPEPDLDPPTHAGVALKAHDTGNVLFLQRAHPHKNPDDPAAGKWEFPGGGLEPGDHTTLHGAIREFEEETGHPFPAGGTVHHTWRSGPYQGHLVVIPEQDALDPRAPRQIENPDGDNEAMAWHNPRYMRNRADTRDEVKSGTPWGKIQNARLEKAAELNDEPEPALPTTTAEDDEITPGNGDGVEDMVNDEGAWGPPRDAKGHIPVGGNGGSSYGERYRQQMSQGIGGDESVNPSTGSDHITPTAAHGSVSDIVAAFQASAAAKALQGSGGPSGGRDGDISDSDIAAAARKVALKNFTPGEQAELINEGGGKVRSRNFGDLRIAGTHYEEIPEDTEELVL